MPSIYRKLLAFVFLSLAAHFAALRAHAQSTCQQFGNVPINNGQYFYTQNEYGSTQTQCATVNGPAFTLTTADFDQTQLGIYTPASYASFLWGCFWGLCTNGSSLPIEMSQLTSSNSTVAISMPSGYKNDAAYDIWFNQTPTNDGQPNGTEVMIWLNQQNIEPYGDMLGTVTIDGADWQVYVATMPSWNLISYQRVQSTNCVRNLNLLPFYQDAETRYTASGAQVLQPSWYLINIQFGFEIWDGGQGLTAYNFMATASSTVQPSPGKRRPFPTRCNSR